LEDLELMNAKLVLAGLVFATAAMSAAFQTEYKGWGLDQEKAQIKRREDPATWMMEILEADRPQTNDYPERPLPIGAFPVPDYDLVGKRSFRGNGTMGMEYPWRDRYVVGNASYVGRSPVNEAFIGDRADEVFLHILVLSDQKLQPDGSNAFMHIYSRNHPHILGQGLFKTTKSEIDYVAFQTADRNAYAIVNMRLFDLRAGRVIIICPQKDGTLRSMQVEAPVLASTDMKDFDANLLKDPRVVKFLDMPGNL
jgi:hypothetical protein